jgi:hypothetical protein
MSINIATPSFVVTPENPVCLQFFGEDATTSEIIVNGIAMTITILNDQVTTFDGLEIQYTSDASPYRWSDFPTTPWVDMSTHMWGGATPLPIVITFNESDGDLSPIVSTNINSYVGTEFVQLKLDYIPMSDRYTSGICMSME